MRQREHPFTSLFHKNIGKCDRALLLLAFAARRLGDLQSGNHGNIPINIHAQIFSLNRNDFIWESGAELKEIVPVDLPARTSVNKVVRQNAFESVCIPVLDRGEYLLFKKQERLLRLGQFFALLVRCGRQFNLQLTSARYGAASSTSPVQPPMTRGTRKCPSSRSGACSSAFCCPRLVSTLSSRVA